MFEKKKKKQDVYNWYLYYYGIESNLQPKG